MLKLDSPVFQTYLTQLSQLVREGVDINTSRNIKSKPLYDWIRSVRDAYSRGTLQPCCITALEATGFNFQAGLRATTHDIARQLAVLQRFRKETGKDFPVKTHPVPEYAAVTQWLYRMRKLHHGGQLSLACIALFEAAGVSLERTQRKVQDSHGLADAVFQGNFSALVDWLTTLEASTGTRNLTYRDTKTNEQARKAYRFIEHMTLKSRQGILTNEHHTQLVVLGFTVNGRAIEDVLTAKPSIRSEEGIAINHANRVADRALAQAQMKLNEAEALAALAKTKHNVAINDLHNSVPTIDTYDTDPYMKGYISTKELASRINYSTSTLTKLLAMNVFINDRHYIMPLGGSKVFWHWATIEADLRDNTLRVLRDHPLKQ